MASQFQETIKKIGNRMVLPLKNLRDKVGLTSEKAQLTFVAGLLAGAIIIAQAGETDVNKNDLKDRIAGAGKGAVSGAIAQKENDDPKYTIPSADERVGNVADRFLGLTGVKGDAKAEFKERVEKEASYVVLETMQGTVNDLASKEVEDTLNGTNSAVNNHNINESAERETLRVEIDNLYNTLKQIEEDVELGVRTDYEMATAQAIKTSNLLEGKVRHLSAISTSSNDNYQPAVDPMESMLEEIYQCTNNIIKKSMYLQLDSVKNQVFENGCGDFFYEDDLNGYTNEYQIKVDGNRDRAVIVSCNGKQGSLTAISADGVKCVVTDGEEVINDSISLGIYNPNGIVDEFLSGTQGGMSCDYTKLDGYTTTIEHENGGTETVKIKFTAEGAVLTRTIDGKTSTLTVGRTTPEQVAEDADEILRMAESINTNEEQMH